MSALAYVLVGLFGGALLVGCVVLALVFFRYARDLRNSIEELRRALVDLTKDNTLAESLSSFRDLVNTGKAMLLKMENLNTTITLFYKAAIRADQLIQETSPEAATGASATYGYDEEAAAQRELQSKLRTAGVQMPADKEIPADKAVGAQV